MIIRAEDAQRLGIKTLSQASQYSSQWQAGFGYEFLERKDGYTGLAKAYNLKFAQPPQQMELGLMYQAIAEKKVDFIAGSATDGLIPVLKLVILEDDKKYFPPYEAVPIFNQAILKKYPDLAPAINQLAGKISADEMQMMNYQVDNKSRPVEEVVQQWFKSKKLPTSPK